VELVDTSPIRRRYSEGVILALGLNVWLSWLVLPGLYLGELTRLSVLLLALAPPILLGVGILRRSAFLLLLCFPATCLLGAAVAPRLVSSAAHSTARLSLLALGLCAFLLGVSLLLSPTPGQPLRTRPLATGPTPPRWRRRVRVYRGLTLLSAVFPLVLVTAVNLSPQNRAYVGELYAGRQSVVFTLFNLGILALWLGLFIVYFVGVLDPHRSGDKELLRDLARLSATPRRGSRWRTVTALLLLSLALLGQLLYLRYR
jgi:hypothetical protein